MIAHKDAKDVFILGSLEDVQAVLDESNINITTIASSRHVGPIKSRVEEWQKNLDLFTRTLVKPSLTIVRCTRTFVYIS